MWPILAVILAQPAAFHLEPRWQVARLPPEQPRPGLAATLAGAHFIYTTWTEQPVRPDDPPQGATTVSLDRMTGAEIWRRPGELQAATADRVVVLRDGALEGLETATGKAVWTWRPRWLPLPLSELDRGVPTDVWAEGTGPHVVFYEQDIFLRHAVIDVTTGQERWQGHGTLNPLGSNRFFRLVPEKDSLRGGRRDERPQTVEGIDRATGAVVWRFETGAAHPQVGTGNGALWVWRAEDRRLVALSPEGQVLSTFWIDQGIELRAEPEPWTLSAWGRGMGAPHVVLDAQTRRLEVTGKGRVEAVLDPVAGTVTRWRPTQGDVAKRERAESGLTAALEAVGLKYEPVVMDLEASAPLIIVSLDNEWVAFARRPTPAPPAEVVIDGRLTGHCLRRPSGENTKKNEDLPSCKGLRVFIGERVAAVDNRCRFQVRGPLAGIQFVMVENLPTGEPGTCVAPLEVPHDFALLGPGRQTLEVRVVERHSDADDDE